MAKRLRASVAGAFHPLADGAFADTEGLGDLALGPTLLLEVPGLEPSGFFPIVGLPFMHESIAPTPSRALDFYTRVSRIANTRAV